jgi:Flp pilus assembly protein TadG
MPRRGAAVFSGAAMTQQRSRIAISDAQAFLRDDGGNVALTFGLLTVLLVAFVGGAVDFASHARLKTSYRDAVDAAVLAGARIKQTGGTDAEAIATANAFMDKIKAKSPLPGAIVFTIVDSGVALQGAADLQMSTSFLGVIGMSQMPVQTTSIARFAQPSDLEISLMLDVTGSMNGQKLQDLKDAVVDLTNIVISDNPSTNKARIALAPFANTVKLGSSHFNAATGTTGAPGYRGCVVERPGNDSFTDASPTAGGYLTPLDDVAPSADCDNDREIFPLTNNKNDLKQKVLSLSAGGSTAGHLGTAWAWYMLSPKWASLFETDQQPASYAELSQKNPSGAPKLRKILVLMTDGEFNTQYVGPDSTTQARALCAEIKKTGIEVFAIGFDVAGNQGVIDTLRGCSSTNAHFYEATSGDALKTAFRDIALKASTVRLTK